MAQRKFLDAILQLTVKTYFILENENYRQNYVRSEKMLQCLT